MTTPQQDRFDFGVQSEQPAAPWVPSFLANPGAAWPFPPVAGTAPAVQVADEGEVESDDDAYCCCGNEPTINEAESGSCMGCGKALP